MADKACNLERRETDDPSELLMEALREAEARGWHHCPRGTPEGDHYDALVEALCKRETKGA